MNSVHSDSLRTLRGMSAVALRAEIEESRHRIKQGFRISAVPGWLPPESPHRSSPDSTRAIYPSPTSELPSRWPAPPLGSGSCSVLPGQLLFHLLLEVFLRHVTSFVQPACTIKALPLPSGQLG